MTGGGGSTGNFVEKQVDTRSPVPVVQEGLRSAIGGGEFVIIITAGACH